MSNYIPHETLIEITYPWSNLSVIEINILL